LYSRSEISTTIGELVATVRVTTNDPRALELAQPLGEEVGGDTGQTVLELAVTAGANQEFAHDEECPPIADHVEGLGKGAVLIVGTHALNVHLRKSICNP
jgi:hypothetical protein